MARPFVSLAHSETPFSRLARAQFPTATHLQWEHGNSFINGPGQRFTTTLFLVFLCGIDGKMAQLGEMFIEHETWEDPHPGRRIPGQITETHVWKVVPRPDNWKVSAPI